VILSDDKALKSVIAKSDNPVTLEGSGLFSAEALSLIDDEFKRYLHREYLNIEGISGISIRQLQNVMRSSA